MRIGMILGRTFPPDIRVEKECRTLIAAGHEVHVLCFQGVGEPSCETVDGVRIHRFRQPSNVFYSLIFRFSQVMRYWLVPIRKMVSDQGIQALHVHDLPLFWTAHQAVDLPVVLDMHEVYPAMMQRDRFEVPSFRRRLKSWLFSVFWWEALERRSVSTASTVIVVVEESKDRLLKMGVPEKKIRVVMNTEDPTHFKYNGQLKTTSAAAFVISYTGGMEWNRGLDFLVSAMPHVLEHVPEAQLWLVGDGPKRPELIAQAADLGVGDRIHFTGWVDFGKVPGYIAASNVCVVPHVVCEHTETTIPHKLFQYMAMGKPVVVTEVGPIQRIVNESECGIVVPYGDSKAMAEGLVSLRRKEVAKATGQRGQKAVYEKYNWTATSKGLLENYAALEEAEA